MNERIVEIDAIDRSLVATALGYGRNTALPSTLADRLEEVLLQIPATVRAITRTEKIERCADSRIVTAIGELSSPTFAGLAADAEMVVYGLVTAGPQMDEHIFNCTDTVDALLYDACGSTLVEQGVNELLHTLEGELNKFVSLPFSPGYCDFPLAQQQELFAVFGTSPLGVTFHPASFMMSPVKSISFVAAAGDTPLNTNPCSICSLPECQHRR